MENQQEIATPDKRPYGVRSQQAICNTTKRITYTAVLAALALIMKFVGQFMTLTPSFKLTLVYTVWLIAGATLGPLGGGAVCFISDVLGAIIFPTGAINPLLILGNTLYGVIAALVFRFTPGKAAVKFIASGIVCTLLCTCLINTAAIWYWYKYSETLTFLQYFVSFRIMQPLVALVNIAVTVAMIPLLKRIKLLPTAKAQKRSK
ncbi:MAG: folate family ECF transporter S component [Roseburia sp.]|nr:folate family ECF transporter S component [Roseburia sp.]